MSLTFPHDSIFDRGVRVPEPPSPDALAPAGAPVESPEGVATSSPTRSSLPATAALSGPSLDETGEEFVPHENDETLRALAEEGATEILVAVQNEVWGSSTDGGYEGVVSPEKRWR